MQKGQYNSVEEGSDGLGDKKRQRKRTERSVMLLSPVLSDHGLGMQPVFCSEDSTLLNAA